MNRNTSEIHDDLKALANELEGLAATGRITMSTDSWNKDYPDTSDQRDLQDGNPSQS